MKASLDQMIQQVRDSRLLQICLLLIALLLLSYPYVWLQDWHAALKSEQASALSQLQRIDQLQQHASALQDRLSEAQTLGQTFNNLHQAAPVYSLAVAQQQTQLENLLKQHRLRNVRFQFSDVNPSEEQTHFWTVRASVTGVAELAVFLDTLFALENATPPFAVMGMNFANNGRFELSLSSQVRKSDQEI